MWAFIFFLLPLHPFLEYDWNLAALGKKRRKSMFDQASEARLCSLLDWDRMEILLKILFFFYYEGRDAEGKGWTVGSSDSCLLKNKNSRIGEFLQQHPSQLPARLEREVPRVPASWVGGQAAAPLSQEDDPLPFGHREEEPTCPSSLKTVSTSRNVATPRWPSHCGTTW